MLDGNCGETVICNNTNYEKQKEIKIQEFENKSYCDIIKSLVYEAKDLNVISVKEFIYIMKQFCIHYVVQKFKHCQVYN